MTKRQGLVVDEPPTQQQQQRTTTEVLSSTKPRKEEEQQLTVLRFLHASAEAAHHPIPGGDEDGRISEEAPARLSPEQESTLVRRAISKLSDRSNEHSQETAEVVIDRPATPRAPGGQQEELGSRRGLLLREVSFVHDDAPYSNDSPESAGHANVVDIDTDFDTDTSSTGSDETANVFWSSGGVEIAGVAQRPTRAASVASTCGSQVDPPPPAPRSPPPCYETARRHPNAEETFCRDDEGRRSKPSPSAMLRKSRNTSPVGAEYLKGAAAAALGKRGRTPTFSSQHGEKGSRPMQASETMLVDEDAPTAVVDGKWSKPGPPLAGAIAGEAASRDGDETPRGEEIDSVGPGRTRKSGGALDQPTPRLSQGIHHMPHHPCTRSTSEADVVAAWEGDARVSERAGGTQEPPAEPPRAVGREARFPSAHTPAPEFRLDLQHEKESATPGRRMGDVEASGGGCPRDDEPGTLPLPPVEVALSADPASSSGCVLPKNASLSWELGSHEVRSDSAAGWMFSPVVVAPSANPWPQGRSPSAVSATSTKFGKSERLEQDQAALSPAAAAAAAAGGARTGADGVVEMPPQQEERQGVLPAGGEASLPSPPVWVTRCLEYWSTCGLVFTLSDGSVGLVFKDNARMVVDPTADTFDYTEAPPSSATAPPPPSPPPSWSFSHEAGAGTERQGRGGKGDSPGHSYPSRSVVTATHQYRLDYFPFYLRRKVEVLRHFREHVLAEDGRGRESGCEPAAAAIAQDREAPLAFIEKWRSVGDTTCLQLSNKIMQVMFSDGTAILLSMDCRSVTVLDTPRETQTLLVAERRRDTMKARVRQAKDMVASFLEGNQARSEGGRSLAEAP